MSVEMKIMKELVNEIEKEDIFDGVTEGDISSREWDSYVESLEREKGALWEQIV